MNMILWIGLGALLGLLASWRLASVCRLRLLIDAALGAIGALLGVLLAVPLPRWLSSELRWQELLVAAIGAVLLLALTRVRAARNARID